MHYYQKPQQFPSMHQFKKILHYFTKAILNKWVVSPFLNVSRDCSFRRLVCLHLYVCICRYIISICVYIYVYVLYMGVLYVYMYVCVCMFTFVCMHMQIYNKYMCIYICICIIYGCLISIVLFIIIFLVHFYTFILINIFRYVFPNSLIIRNFLLFNSICLSFLSLKVFILVFD
jgi:hypothetical protein